MNKTTIKKLLSQLVRLMLHVIKWKSQPEKRSHSWVYSINDARNQINKESFENKKIANSEIIENWEDCFKKAQKQAEIEMGKSADVKELTQKEVFEDNYELNE